MTAALVEKAPAKVNLTLRIVGRRADGYHELESLVVFADCADTLVLRPGGDATLDISGPFAAACGPPDGNLVLKAHAALRARITGLKAGHFSLEKAIPVAAGLGGGSADAAAAIRLLAHANELALDDERVAGAALATGADVPACLESRARVMRGIGEQLSAPLDLPPLAALLVNPGVPLSTREVFAAFSSSRGGKASQADVPSERDALIAWLGRHDNDLAPSAIACVPAIADVLSTLEALPGARLARMSGSGSTCFALFTSHAAAAAAAQSIKAKRKEWWIVPATFG